MAAKTSATGKLVEARTFRVQKGKLLGQIPGYDSDWLRNISLTFVKAMAGSPEFRICEWWMRLSLENESRNVMIPFWPTAQPAVVIDQLQVNLDGRHDPRSSTRISNLKIRDNVDLLHEVEEFINDYIIGGAALTTRQSSLPTSPPVFRVAVGSGGSFDDKENAGSPQVAAPRSFKSASSSAAAVTGRSVSNSAFYGKGPPAKPAASSSGWIFNDSKPTSTLGPLRDRYTRGGPSLPAAPQNRASPSVKRSDDRSTKPAGLSKTPLSASSKNAKWNSDKTTPTSSGRVNPILASSKLPCWSFMNDRGKDEYEFRDENVDDDLKDITVRPANRSTPSPEQLVRTRSSSPIGMLNLGNSCYMNAVLQALFAQPTFNYDLRRIDEAHFIEMQTERLRERERLENGAVSPKAMNPMLLAKTAEETSLLFCVLNLLRSCDAGADDVAVSQQKQRLQAVKNASKKFIDSQQHDAQEFLCCVLNDLNEEHREGFMAKCECEGTTKSEANAAELLANPVEANFDFKLRKSLSCRTCNCVASETLESFNNLSVPIPDAEASAETMRREAVVGSSSQIQEAPSCENTNPLEDANNLNKSLGDDLPELDFGVAHPSGPPEQSLQRCIDHFFQKEEIEYRPEQCGHKDGGVASYCLASLPRIFVVHLKRFLYTFTSNNGTKCTLPVSVPLELDLSKYCTPKDLNLPKLVDSPLAPRSALKSEIMSPVKIPPSPSTSPVVNRQSKCRKRLASVETGDTAAKMDGENDENVPCTNFPPKRLRSAIGEVVEDSASEASDENWPSAPGRFCKYRLSAVISHTGSTLDYGHYTSDAYHSELKKWFRFDDLSVRGISEAAVLDENKRNGYIFFYTALPVLEQAMSNSMSGLQNEKSG